MHLDLEFFAKKLNAYLGYLLTTTEQVSNGTGITQDRIDSLIAAKSAPSGDEVLILADYLRCDFKQFVSNNDAVVQRYDAFYRAHGTEFTRDDRWAIQEFLSLCSSEQDLFFLTDRRIVPFQFEPKGTFYKRQGQDAASLLKKSLGYSSDQVHADIYHDFRQIGIHVFRRHLGNSNISGLFIQHPDAGPCVLVNYDEDIYRQRFTVAHEVAHAILDGTDFGVSKRDAPSEYIEVRANAFAAAYLLPPELLKTLPNPNSWDEKQVITWAEKLKVSTHALAIALKQNGLVLDDGFERIRSFRVPSSLKVDPELPDSMTPTVRARKLKLQEKGLSLSYIRLVMDAYKERLITFARAAEMLLTNEFEIRAVVQLFGETMDYA